MYLSENEKTAVLENLKIVPGEIWATIFSMNSNPFIQYDDLLQHGRLALCIAAKKANPAYPFEPYARACVHYALLNYVNEYKNGPANERVLSFDMELVMDGGLQTSLYDVTGDYKQTESFSEIECLDLLVRLAGEYKGITRNGVIVIMLRYLGHTDSEIARVFGREQNSLRAWVARARLRLRENQMARDFFNAYKLETRDKAC